MAPAGGHVAGEFQLRATASAARGRRGRAAERRDDLPHRLGALQGAAPARTRPHNIFLRCGGHSRQTISDLYPASSTINHDETNNEFKCSSSFLPLPSAQRNKASHPIGWVCQSARRRFAAAMVSTTATQSMPSTPSRTSCHHSSIFSIHRIHAKDRVPTK